VPSYTHPLQRPVAFPLYCFYYKKDHDRYLKLPGNPLFRGCWMIFPEGRRADWIGESNADCSMTRKYILSKEIAVGKWYYSSLS